MQEVTTGVEAGTEAKQTTVTVAANEEQLDIPTLLAEYWHIAACWRDSALAIKTCLTVGEAIQVLRKIRDHSALLPGGSKLSRMASNLLWDIVRNQADNPEVEAAID